jgi:SdpI/YfhL protein family
MYNQERWDFSQQFAGRMLALAGVVSSVVGVLAMFFTMPENWSVGLGIGLVIANVIWPIFVTEKALRERFGKL